MRGELRRINAAADVPDNAELADALRPKTRGDCLLGPRPCPWVACRHHMYLDVKSTGSVRINHAGLEVWDLLVSCSLDVADTGPQSCATVARALNVTRQRANQIEQKAIGQLRGQMTPDIRGQMTPDVRGQMTPHAWGQLTWGQLTPGKGDK